MGVVSLVWPAEHGVVTIDGQWSHLQGGKVLATYRRHPVDELAFVVEVMHEICRLRPGWQSSDIQGSQEPGAGGEPGVQAGGGE